MRENEHACDEKSLIDGTVSYVTGAFGLGCASVVVNTITASIREHAEPAKSKFDQKKKQADVVTAAADVASEVSAAVPGEAR